MRIDCKLHGNQRKHLVFQIGCFLHAVPRYLMLPTKGYQIGELNIDEKGVITIPDGYDATELLEHLAICGFSASEQLKLDRLVIAMPRKGLDDAAIERLWMIANNKEELFTKAFGVKSLDIKVDGEKVQFSWFVFTSDGEEAKAYSIFIKRLCMMAKEQKRMLNRKVDTDNDKYAMRCFLLCLGLVGMEHSASRKILLSRLAGNGAFRHPELEAMLKRTREVYLREIFPGSVIAVLHTGRTLGRVSRCIRLSLSSPKRLPTCSIRLSLVVYRKSLGFVS